MLVAAIVAMLLHPTHRIADDGDAIVLEKMLPKQFGEWKEDLDQLGQVINPQQKEVLDRIYNQTLSRTYINASGQRIMLSVAYGADQSDAKQLHYPEVCYPAQGFQILSKSSGVIKTTFGSIPVKRLLAVIGTRSEPLTYWTTVGNKVVLGNRETKLEQLRYGFRGEIPDGLLFRVSSISSDETQGYILQESFLQSIIAAMPADTRLRMAGLL